MKMNQEVYKIVKHLADQYANALALRVASRTEEMKSDDTSHYLLYRVLVFSFVNSLMYLEFAIPLRRACAI